MILREQTKKEPLSRGLGITVEGGEGREEGKRVEEDGKLS
jgi:hypothetical protein